MDPSAAVLVCALDLLGRSHTAAPVTLLAAPPRYASSNAEAFVQHDPDRIYLITSTAAFRDAANPRSRDQHDGCVKVASIIVHEEWHLRYGSDERGAYEAQLMTLTLLRAAPETVAMVRKSMAVALQASAGAAPAVRRAAQSTAADRDR